MSEPTYRITTEHVPDSHYPNIPWHARIVRLSDGESMQTQYAGNEAAAIERASEYIARLSESPQPGHIFFANEDGSIDSAPTPESLRA